MPSIDNMKALGTLSHQWHNNPTDVQTSAVHRTEHGRVPETARSTTSVANVQSGDIAQQINKGRILQKPGTSEHLFHHTHADSNRLLSRYIKSRLAGGSVESQFAANHTHANRSDSTHGSNGAAGKPVPSTSGKVYALKNGDGYVVKGSDGKYYKVEMTGTGVVIAAQGSYVPASSVDINGGPVSVMQSGASQSSENNQTVVDADTDHAKSTKASHHASTVVSRHHDEVHASQTSTHSSANQSGNHAKVNSEGATHIAHEARELIHEEGHKAVDTHANTKRDSALALLNKNL